MKAKGSLVDADVRFAANLRHQEAQRWAEYLKRGTPEALTAWRQLVSQIRKMRGQAA